MSIRNAAHPGNWVRNLASSHKTGPAELILYTHDQVCAAIATLKNTERFCTILKLGQQPPISPEACVRGKTGRRNRSSVSNKDTQQTLQQATRKGSMISGKKPNEYPGLANVGTRLSEALYGLGNQAQLSRLMEYLHLNGQYELVPVQNKGSCLFAAIRRGMDVPLEYSNTHLRRQLVMTVIKYSDFFFEMIKNSLLGQYGHVRLTDEELQVRQGAGDVTSSFLAEQRLPGPFSFVTWLEHVLKRTSWGDEITLVVMSMMWQMRITVVYAETLLQERVRHNEPLEKADVVIVYCGGTHYCGAVKRKDEIDADGNVVFNDYTHDTQDVVRSTGYNLQDDDPGVYTDCEDIDHFDPRREWPEESLPSKPCQAESGSGTAAAKNADLITNMLQVHHVHVDTLKRMGVDACKEYQQARMEAVLNRVTSGQTLCTICDVNFASTQKLKNHIGIIHLHKSNYKCHVCNKYFCDSVTLKIHTRCHNKESAYIHRCNQCGKSYPSTGKLNEHMQTHGGGFTCQFCQKCFKLKRNRDEHEQGCSSRPADNPVEKHKCDLCDKEYVYSKDLSRHKRTKHKP